MWCWPDRSSHRRAPEGAADLLVHHHRYEVATSAPVRPPGTLVARLAPIPLRRPVTVEKIWYDVRSSTQMIVGRVTHGDHLGLQVTLHRPSVPVRPSTLGMVKVIVEGVVSALHTNDGTQLDVVADRLGDRLSPLPPCGRPADRPSRGWAR